MEWGEGNIVLIAIKDLEKEIDIKRANFKMDRLFIVTSARLVG